MFQLDLAIEILPECYNCKTVQEININLLLQLKCASLSVAIFISIVFYLFFYFLFFFCESSCAFENKVRFWWIVNFIIPIILNIHFLWFCFIFTFLIFAGCFFFFL